MSWKRYSSSYREQLYSLLVKKEHEALSFSSRFIRYTKFSLQERKETIYIDTDKNDTITSSLMLTRGGQLLPVISENISSDGISFREAFSVIGNGRYYINSIMGEKNIVESIFRELYSIAPQDKITEYNYHIMIIGSRDNFVPPGLYDPDNSFKFRKPALSDIEKLMPLQEMYEKEEVLPSENLYDPDSAKRYIRDSVKNRISVICENSGKIISKANTNGDGINFSQIGGVYTLPEFRNRGIGRNVTGKLVEKIFEDGKNPSLFVKQENHPAVSVYKKLGFTITSEFKIIYFF